MLGGVCAWVPGCLDSPAKQLNAGLKTKNQGQISRGDLQKVTFQKTMYDTTHLMLICLGVIKQIGLLRVVPLQKYP